MRLTQSHLFEHCNLRRQTAGPRNCKLIDHYSYLFSCCCCFCCCCCCRYRCCCCCCSIPQLNTLVVTRYVQLYIDKINALHRLSGLRVWPVLLLFCFVFCCCCVFFSYSFNYQVTWAATRRLQSICLYSGGWIYCHSRSLSWRR